MTEVSQFKIGNQHRKKEQPPHIEWKNLQSAWCGVVVFKISTLDWGRKQARNDYAHFTQLRKCQGSGLGRLTLQKRESCAAGTGRESKPQLCHGAQIREDHGMWLATGCTQSRRKKAGTDLFDTSREVFDLLHSKDCWVPALLTKRRSWICGRPTLAMFSSTTVGVLHFEAPKLNCGPKQSRGKQASPIDLLHDFLYVRRGKLLNTGSISCIS